MPARNIVEILFHDIYEFSRGQQLDDVTAVVAKFDFSE